jgi:hypothetical protein
MKSIRSYNLQTLKKFQKLEISEVKESDYGKIIRLWELQTLTYEEG